MKKPSNTRRAADDLEIPELGPDFFANATVGRHYARIMAKSNVVRIASDLCAAFPNESAVNHALRELLKFREVLAAIPSPKTKKRKSA
jgi:hypothetical protein